MKKENCHLFSLGLMFVLCLFCHVTPQSLALTLPTFPRYDGVGLQGPCSADSPELHVSHGFWMPVMQAKLGIHNSEETADPWMDDKMCQSLLGQLKQDVTNKGQPCCGGGGREQMWGQDSGDNLDIGDTGRYGRGREIGWHLAVCAESRP